MGLKNWLRDIRVPDFSVHNFSPRLYSPVVKWTLQSKTFQSWTFQFKTFQSWTFQSKTLQSWTFQSKTLQSIGKMNFSFLNFTVQDISVLNFTVPDLSVLEKISLVFWKIWRHQKNFLESTDWNGIDFLDLSVLNK